MRPEILFPLFAPITSLKGVGARVAPLLEKVAGPIVRDVVFLTPQNLVRRSVAKAASAKEGEEQTFLVTIESHQRPARANQPWKIRAFDDTGFVTLVYFRAGAHLEQSHPRGARRVVSGKVERSEFDGALQIVHPDYFLPADRADEIPEVEAIYPATAGLASRAIRRYALEALARTPDLPEWQDAAWLTRQRWPRWRAALEALHHPASEADLAPQSAARRRLAFDELVAHQLALAQRKAARRSEPARVVPASPLTDRIEADLPFRLTGAQVRALAEIRGDLASGDRMTRLVQGDVGSGKTVVAMLAMADVAVAGAQSALMAPTEILARQHFETLAGPLASHGIKAVLLTGRDKGAGRAEKLAALAGGGAAVAVGTHALFQDDVAFHALALTVIDEQHRFGVSERARLQAKGEAAHLLAMSATPIPRTLELTVFGDLDVSRIDQKPPGRTPVATRAAPMPRVGEIVERLKTAVRGGAQAFWICPLVSESETADLAAAEARAAALRQVFGARVGLVHGRMPGPAKDQVMADFAEGRLAVLVATTVVEVGVDVPAATIMVIEQAERFGLAQLHQLRGRVGRGQAESSCVLLYDPPLSEIAKTRLDILRRTDDGFVIAEKDLELRGGGDPLGLKQSGFPAYRLADPVAHRDLIPAAADDARLMLARDPGLTTPRGRAVTVLQELFDWRAGAGGEAG
ncbi:MAG TPA: ATP-dependent DNA helicase RecG [Caulobacteraceae bacterium]|nr:ATP-dependent DNA helicase RecG [Caulobacteraceae bacterium]